MLDPLRPEGTLLAERYELGPLLGQGGMGIVHRAWDRREGRPVAVKFLRERAGDEIARARFRLEGEALGRLDHPGLTRLHEAATDGDEPYLVMELVEGRPLSLTCHQAPADPTAVLSLGIQLAEALDHVHEHRLVHRDVKPGNILVRDDGTVKLADFGIVRLLDGLTRHTATGMTMGTAAYLAPEQVRGESVTTKVDVYSLGLILVEMLSGRPAWTGSWQEVAVARLAAAPVVPAEVDPHLRRVLEQMTTGDPAARPPASRVAAELRAIRTGTATTDPLTADALTADALTPDALGPDALTAGPLPVASLPVAPSPVGPLPTGPLTAGPGPDGPGDDVPAGSPGTRPLAVRAVERAAVRWSLVVGALMIASASGGLLIGRIDALAGRAADAGATRLVEGVGATAPPAASTPTVTAAAATSPRATPAAAVHRVSYQASTGRTGRTDRVRAKAGSPAQAVSGVQPAEARPPAAGSKGKGPEKAAAKAGPEAGPGRGPGRRGPG
jgi:eukaryotic-like serine/threonine-protein kinase